MLLVPHTVAEVHESIPMGMESLSSIVLAGDTAKRCFASVNCKLGEDLLASFLFRE